MSKATVKTVALQPARSVVLGFQAETGGERPLLRVARRALSDTESEAEAEPASWRTAAPVVACVSALDPTGLDAQEVQCCGVLRWQIRSWCSKGAAATNNVCSTTPSRAKRRRRRSSPRAIQIDDNTRVEEI